MAAGSASAALQPAILTWCCAIPNPDAESPGLFDLKEAFIESNLPIRVDIMDWARIPESFHREIERAHVVIQAGSR